MFYARVPGALMILAMPPESPLCSPSRLHHHPRAPGVVKDSLSTAIFTVRDLVGHAFLHVIAICHGPHRVRMDRGAEHDSRACSHVESERATGGTARTSRSPQAIRVFNREMIALSAVRSEHQALAGQ